MAQQQLKQQQLIAAAVLPRFQPLWSSSRSDAAVVNDESPSKSSSLSLKGCVCVVTGASRGIGKGIALALGRQGATVYVTGTSSSSSNHSSHTNNNHNDNNYKYVTNDIVGGVGTIEETAEAVTAAGGKGIAVYCNHANDENVRALFGQVQRDEGRLDMLVNNVFRVPTKSSNKLLDKFWEDPSNSIDTWDAVHTVGLRSHFVASAMAVPLMLRSYNNTNTNNNNTNNTTRTPILPRSIIIMIGSFGGISYTFNVAYGVGKAGVDRLAKDMAVELRPRDVCVVSLWPGLVLTERTEAAVRSGEWEANVGLPLEQAETPEFTGRAVVAVATDPHNMKKTGTYQVVAELAGEYGFTDVDGTTRPPSIRSLKFLMPAYGMDEETRKRVPQWLIPNLKLPFWVMAGGNPQDRD